MIRGSNYADNDNQLQSWDIYGLTTEGNWIVLDSHNNEPFHKTEVRTFKVSCDKEIVSAVKEDFYIPNSVFLKLRNKIKPIETMPFVENIDIRITGLNSITIRVNENLRAGCISYAGKYVYFDKDGKRVEMVRKGETAPFMPDNSAVLSESGLPETEEEKADGTDN